MSEYPTLDGLHEDFLAVRDTIGKTGALAELLRSMSEDVWIDFNNRVLVTIHPAQIYSPLVEKLTTAANVYVIARDFGLDHAMLYKLSAGHIDPRTKPEPSENRQ